MSTLKKKLLIAATVGTVLQVVIQPGVGSAAGCGNYLVYGALSAFDACAVVNCSNGTFFNFCAPVKLFADCP